MVDNVPNDVKDFDDTAAVGLGMRNFNPTAVVTPVKGGKLVPFLYPDALPAAKRKRDMRSTST